MPSYDTFAPFYDLVMGDRAKEAALLHTLIKRHAPKAKSLLELGCGSGSLVKVLRKSFLCVGIDLSEGMIRVAKKKVLGTKFITGDITSFDLGERFDVVICAFDTINHVLNFKKWTEIFRRAHAHLSPNGIFVFDMNTRYKLDRFVTEPAFAESARGVITIVDAVKTGPLAYRIEVKALKHKNKNLYALHEIKVPEVTFPVERVTKALNRYFDKVILFDADRSRPSAKTEELYFICKGPLMVGR